MHDRSEGEAAVLVTDAWQRRGLGTELLSQVVRVGGEEKYSRLVAEILRDNLATQAIFKKVGFHLRPLEDGSSVSAVLELAH